MDIEVALRATVFGRPEDTADDVAQHFAPDYTQVTDGVRSDYAAFVDHIRHVRTLVASGELVVHDQAQEDDVVADRHTVRITKTDGATSELEVLLIGRLAPDGRLLRVVETTRLVDGDERDANIGSARPSA